jgi:hypothetical protein
MLDVERNSGRVLEQSTILACAAGASYDDLTIGFDLGYRLSIR